MDFKLNTMNVLHLQREQHVCDEGPVHSEDVWYHHPASLRRCPPFAGQGKSRLRQNWGKLGEVGVG